MVGYSRLCTTSRYGDTCWHSPLTPEADEALRRGSATCADTSSGRHLPRFFAASAEWQRRSGASRSGRKEKSGGLHRRACLSRRRISPALRRPFAPLSPPPPHSAACFLSSFPLSGGWAGGAIHRSAFATPFFAGTAVKSQAGRRRRQSAPGFSLRVRTSGPSASRGLLWSTHR